ncbi:UDP-glucuronosyltransferase 1A1-like isoform X8 [Rana temporaria]|uniref:UDP-glucuronosyltransferase 1A1-like isoform X8 n=1 Tax=Rana temporaria TaxID=8407 RepID=UPI001AADEF8A|nr:UDP-glucuronosyltransferase 1A1-like isoform X8 [Rana temporaria]
MAAIILSLMFIWIVVILGLPTLAESGNVLVIAQDTDTWLDMRTMVDKIQQNGHEIVLVIPRNMMDMGSFEGITVKMYSAPLLKSGLSINLEPISGQSLMDSLLSAISTEYKRMKYTASVSSSTCLDLLADQELLSFLEKIRFDVSVMDPFFPCGPILAKHLQLRSIYFLPSLPCGWDKKAVNCPNSDYSDLGNNQNDLFQRVRNVLFHILEPLACRQIETEYNRLASKFLHRDVKLLEIFSQAELWLYKYDFVLESAKPLMPNMLFIGGHCCPEKKRANPDFEKLINSSGDHGFVVFSLGSMVSEIPIHKAMDIAEALRFIPQTVIWRYTGQVPSNLGENTHLVKWLPQNDLLAHPKARAFITHAGSHGIYEGICNAVPMVMLPLFGDQMDNAKRIESRGAGITLNVLDLIPEDLSNALTSVINNSSYKENIQRLSDLHLDRPIHPLDLAVHWVEFVMRHKGAPHLRPAAHDLNWIQYHSIDVFAFLFAVLVTSLFISIKCCAFTFRCCCRRKSSKGKSKSKKE